MNDFLKDIANLAKDRFNVVILDGASSHKSADLIVPENIALLRLPPYSPELNPQEHIWDEVREKEFPNCVFDAMEKVINQLQTGLPKLSSDPAKISSITYWPWIMQLNNSVFSPILSDN